MMRPSFNFFSSGLMMRPSLSFFDLMYAQIFFVTSVRGAFFTPQIAASASLSIFGAKMPTPFFFMAATFFLAAADFAFFPAAFFAALIVAFVAFVIVVFVVVTVVFVIAIEG